MIHTEPKITRPTINSGASDEHSAHLQTYVLGLSLAILLMIASFWVAKTHLIYDPGIPMALATLAVAQTGIHLAFFLHLTRH